VQNGTINPNEGDIVTEKGRIKAKEFLKVLGIPVTQSQEVRDQEFIEIASKAL
jgi:phosphoribosylaminoimidazole carboxylase (NCAIR synthetase)